MSLSPKQISVFSENQKRRFTKRIVVKYYFTYHQRRTLATSELRRSRANLLFAYKMLLGSTALRRADFFRVNAYIEIVCADENEDLIIKLLRNLLLILFSVPYSQVLWNSLPWNPTSFATFN